MVTVGSSISHVFLLSCKTLKNIFSLQCVLVFHATGFINWCKHCIQEIMDLKYFYLILSFAKVILHKTL